MGRDNGIILVNVLVALALGAAMVVLMFTSQDNLIDRFRRASAADQAEALAMGGEASVVAALMRDLIAGTETDNLTEEWARIQQASVRLATGTFALRVTDAQALFDINQLKDGGYAQAQTFALLMNQAGLPASLGQSITSQVQRRGPLTDLTALQDIDERTISILRTIAVALPVAGDVNLNTAPLPVLTAVMGNGAMASRLVSLRDSKGFVTPEDLGTLGVLAGTTAGFNSDIFDVEVEAEVDDVQVTLRSRILRLHRTPTEREVVVISRRFGPAYGSVVHE